MLARSTPTEVYHVDLDYDTPDGPRAFPFMDSCPTAFNFGNPETQSCSFSVTFNPFREGPITVFLKTGNSLDDLGEPVATLSGAGLPAAKSKKKGRCKKKGKKQGRETAGTAKKRKGCKKKGKKKRR